MISYVLVILVSLATGQPTHASLEGPMSTTWCEQLIKRDVYNSADATSRKSPSCVSWPDAQRVLSQNFCKQAAPGSRWQSVQFDCSAPAPAAPAPVAAPAASAAPASAAASPAAPGTAAGPGAQMAPASAPAAPPGTAAGPDAPVAPVGPVPAPATPAADSDSEPPPVANPDPDTVTHPVPAPK